MSFKDSKNVLHDPNKLGTEATRRLKILILITLDFLIDKHMRLFIFREKIVPVRAY